MLNIVHPFGIIEIEMWKALYCTNPFTVVWIASPSQLPAGLLYLITWMLSPLGQGGSFATSCGILPLFPLSWGGLAAVQTLPRSQPAGAILAQTLPSKAQASSCTRWVLRRQKGDKEHILFCDGSILIICGYKICMAVIPEEEEHESLATSPQ